MALADFPPLFLLVLAGLVYGGMLALVAWSLWRLGADFVAELTPQQRTNIQNWLASCTIRMISATPITNDSSATTMIKMSRILSVGVAG